MTYRVIQWATGGVGRAAIQAILSHPELELVGAWVHSADKVGRDAGDWFYPGQRDVSELEAACQKGGVTLHGTGIHPGGITERFPLMLSALSRSVTHVRRGVFRHPQLWRSLRRR
jgi:hypothetical protein